MKQFLLLLALIMMTAACSVNDFTTMLTKGDKMAVDTASTAQNRVVADLPDYGPAPELTNTVWLNSSPLRLADLRGKVVLLDMWTLGCINCIHVIPSVRGWYYKYYDKGLRVIGNHFPEFNYEREISNLKDALVRLDVPYPVAQDNDGATWNAYNNRYWPSLYLIDKQGHLRYNHIGEGAYVRTEEVIEQLLAETYP
jgi:thiol-disulfide isomerase/thioredoxin